jgi:hypothetical protein
MKEADKSLDSELDFSEFCEMMCPSGFRSFPNSITAVDEDYKKVCFTAGFGWHENLLL